MGLWNPIGTVCEFCAFIGVQVGNANFGLIYGKGAGDITINRCMFKDVTGELFRCGVTGLTFRVWQCMFNLEVPAAIPGASRVDMIDNLALYVDTKTIERTVSSRDCIVLHLVIDKDRTPTLPSGDLRNAICAYDAMTHENEKWGPGIEGHESGVVKSAGDNECARIRSCTFSDLT
jgi:hypothetical protein